MSDVVIYGTGGHARELYCWWHRGAGQTGRQRLLGFLDDRPATHGTLVLGHPVLGGAEWLAGRPQPGVLVGVGTSAARWRTVQLLRGFTDHFPAVADPSAVVARHTELGPGAIVAGQGLVAGGVRMGAFVLVNFGASVGQGCVLSDFVSVSPAARVGPGVALAEGVEVGTGAVVEPGLALGLWSTVGAGAWLDRATDPHAVWVGNPVRHVRTRDADWFRFPPGAKA